MNDSIHQEAEKMAMMAKDALEDKKGEDIRVLDLNGLSNIADFFVIGSGNNPNQIRAMADSVNENFLTTAVLLCTYSTKSRETSIHSKEYGETPKSADNFPKISPMG